MSAPDFEGLGRFLLYQTEDGQSRVEVLLEDGSVWLSQQGLATLYQVTKQNVSYHLNNIFRDEELLEARVVKESLTTAADGKRYWTRYYNLEAILAVGYRVRSHRGTKFRQWATERLSDYVIKGFALDDERLRNANTLGGDYFDELLERIRDIRASEKRFYQKIRDIYKLAIDYDANAPETRAFFQIVQNKLHFAVAHMTAAEIISSRAEATKPNMGLTTWSGSTVRRKDVTTAKNYLSDKEIDELNRIVVMYLDFAEDQARRGRPVYMREWRERLDAFLRFNERDVLTNAGNISMEVAHQLALDQFERFDQQRRALQVAQEAETDDRAFEDAVKKIGTDEEQ